MLPLAYAAEDLYAKIDSALKDYIGAEVPMYGNERVNVYLADGTPIGYAITSNGVFYEMGEGKIDDPTMNIYIEDGDTINSIMEADNKLDKFYELKGQGKIKVDPVGFGKNIKYFFTNIIGRIASWFS